MENVIFRHLLEHYPILLWQMTNIWGDEKLEHIRYTIWTVFKGVQSVGIN